MQKRNWRIFPVKSLLLRTQRHRKYYLSNPHWRFPAICPGSLRKLSEQTIAWMDDGWHFVDFYLPSAILGMIYKMSGFWFLPQSSLPCLCRESMSHEDSYCSQTPFTWSSQSGHWNNDRKAILDPDSLFFNSTQGGDWVGQPSM